MTSFEERLKEAREKAKKLDAPTSWQATKTNTFQQTVNNDLNKTGNTLVQQKRNQQSAEIAARAGGSLMEKATVETPKQSPFKTAFDVVDRGAGYFNQGVASTVDLVANALPRLEGAVFGTKPEATFTGQILKPVTDATGKFKNWVDQTVANIDQRVQTDTKDNRAASIAANLGSQTVAALPNAVLAFLSGGGSAATQLAAQPTGVSGAVTTAANKALQNPLTKVSFAQSLGQSYEEAKASGASDAEAMTAATLSSLFNAAIETGGGVETLPGEIRNADLSTGKKAWEWFKSALEEGGEEVVQSVITNMTNKGIFDAEKPLVSTTDENAVVNPYRMLQEFGSGAAVGGLLGGGQMLGNALMGMGNGRIATPPAEVRNDSVKPTPQRPTVESVMPKVQPPVADVTPSAQQEAAQPAMGAADSGFDPISHASIEYGAIPPGEKASRVIDVPTSMDGKTRVSQYARTGAEARVTNDEMAQHIMDLVAENKLSHEIFTDDAALEAAGEKIAEAYRTGQGYNVYTRFLQDVAAGKAGKDLMATGSLLYADAAANSDYESASELFVALTDLQTRAGQTVQAARLLKKLSPEGRVWTVNKIVGKIQNEVDQGRKPDKQIKIEVDDKLIDAFKNAKTTKAQAKAMDNIYKAVAEQMLTTLGDAVNEFRYFMMLGNVSTHLKNLSGNLGQTIMVALKNTIATPLEAGVDAASKAFGGKGIQRTKAFLNLASESDRALMGAAWADYENVQDDISGAGKYKDSARYQVSKYQSYWKLNDPKTKAGELVSKGLQALEKAPQANSKLMDVEDRWFSQPNYAVALAGYMKANKLTEPNDAAREYAVKEAQKATFRDLNAVSKWAKSLGKTKFTKFLVDSVFPFKATPANVGVRAVEYSPAGLAVTLGKAYVAVRKGEFSAAQFIDDLSANATGSLLAGLGYLLAQSGVLRVAGIGDEKEKQQQALEGHKNNSLYNVPIEFVSPAAATLLLGGAIYEAAATKELDGKGYSIEDGLNALSGVADPILETTMLDGLSSILSTVRSSGGKVNGKLLTDIGVQILGNYIGSFMSSQLSRVYAATDDAKRMTYVDKTKDDSVMDLPSVQRMVQGLQYKSPHRTDMVQDIDAWGRPIEGNKGTGGTDFENFMESLFNVITPTYPGKVQETAVDKELKRLYRAEGVDNSKVSLFMRDAAKYFSVDGKRVGLTGEQWEQYQTDRGQTALEVREAIMNSKAYKNLSDTTRAVAMDIALEYATGYAKEQLDVGYEIDTKWMAALVGSSPEEIAKTIIERAVARTED